MLDRVKDIISKLPENHPDLGSVTVYDTSAEVKVNDDK